MFLAFLVLTVLLPPQESTPDEVDTLQDLETLLKSQEHTMSQLDKQRSNIVSMLQRGKQLTVESTLPAVQESVATLENQWNKTYTKSSEALHKLKSKCIPYTQLEVYFAFGKLSGTELIPMARHRNRIFKVSLTRTMRLLFLAGTACLKYPKFILNFNSVS